MFIKPDFIVLDVLVSAVLHQALDLFSHIRGDGELIGVFAEKGRGEYAIGEQHSGVVFPCYGRPWAPDICLKLSRHADIPQVHVKETLLESVASQSTDTDRLDELLVCTFLGQHPMAV